MPKIEFRENKILKLSNVLSRKSSGDMFSQEKEFAMFQNWLSIKGYHTVGPLMG